MYTSSHSLHHPHNLTDPVDWLQGPKKRTATKQCYREIIQLLLAWPCQGKVGQKCYIYLYGSYKLGLQVMCKKNAPKSIDNVLFQSEDGFALQV